MSQTATVRSAIKAVKGNSCSRWNRSESSEIRSIWPEDAANRVMDGYADIRDNYAGPRFGYHARIFTMGSCFAREIERALIARNRRVISIDRSIQRVEFKDADGRYRTSFFHRFTPLSMAQEFEGAFGKLENWTNEALIFEDGDQSIDLNYWQVSGSDNSHLANVVRRRVAQKLVRQVVHADLIILTLGLIEAWIHKPSGLTANFISPSFLRRNHDEFLFRTLSFKVVSDCLERIYKVIKTHNRRNFRVVVTVSPVPLSATFTSSDIVAANMRSKSTLCAAANEWASRHEDAHYFPSYEMVVCSGPKQAWKADRLHVRAGMVERVVDAFTRSFLESENLSSHPGQGLESEAGLAAQGLLSARDLAGLDG